MRTTVHTWTIYTVKSQQRFSCSSQATVSSNLLTWTSASPSPTCARTGGARTRWGRTAAGATRSATATTQVVQWNYEFYHFFPHDSQLNIICLPPVKAFLLWVLVDVVVGADPEPEESSVKRWRHVDLDVHDIAFKTFWKLKNKTNFRDIGKKTDTFIFPIYLRTINKLYMKTCIKE